MIMQGMFLTSKDSENSRYYGLGGTHTSLDMLFGPALEGKPASEATRNLWQALQMASQSTWDESTTILLQSNQDPCRRPSSGSYDQACYGREEASGGAGTPGADPASGAYYGISAPAHDSNVPASTFAAGPASSGLCTHCGTAYSNANAKFCSNCGTPRGS
jgi:hypothetical protein